MPTVETGLAQRTFTRLHQAIQNACVRACHDLSEGGLAVAAAEMAFAGGLGAAISLQNIKHDVPDNLDIALLFSESNSRFLCEIAADKQSDFEQTLGDVPHSKIGEVTDSKRLAITGTNGATRIDHDLATLKEAWQAPLRW